MRTFQNMTLVAVVLMLGLSACAFMPEEEVSHGDNTTQEFRQTKEVLLTITQPAAAFALGDWEMEVSFICNISTKECTPLTAFYPVDKEVFTRVGKEMTLPDDTKVYFADFEGKKEEVSHWEMPKRRLIWRSKVGNLFRVEPISNEISLSKKRTAIVGIAAFIYIDPFKIFGGGSGAKATNPTAPVVAPPLGPPTPPRGGF